MNDNFRKPQYVKRYEYTYYDLQNPLNTIVANGATQLKEGYRFVLIIHQNLTQLIGTTLIWKLISNL